MKDDSQESCFRSKFRSPQCNNNGYFGERKRNTAGEDMFNEFVERFLTKYICDHEQMSIHMPCCVLYGVPCIHANIGYNCLDICIYRNAHEMKSRMDMEER